MARVRVKKWLKGAVRGFLLAGLLGTAPLLAEEPTSSPSPAAAPISSPAEAAVAAPAGTGAPAGEAPAAAPPAAGDYVYTPPAEPAGPGIWVGSDRKPGDYVWTVVAAILVFFMQAGFACLESGFTRQKNAVNVFMKGVMDFCIGSLAFFFIGFALMFGSNHGGYWGTDGFCLEDYKGPWLNVYFLFQVVFAGAAATIVAGALSERVKFSAYLVYCLVCCAVIYPVFGNWAWGNGLVDDAEHVAWLGKLTPGFLDFAGSSVVHSVGGWCALAGIIVIGPRLGKFTPDGKANAIAGHNIPLAALGTFILWLGWFGFNPGSTTAVGAPDYLFARIAVNTNLAACAGAVAAMITAWIKFGKPDTGMALNGALAGLVAITAPCNGVTPGASVVIGAVGGVLVVLSVLMFDQLRLDDPVGAMSVHLTNGVWGTFSCGLFNTSTGLFYGHGWGQVSTQLKGIGACAAWTFTAALVLFTIIKHTIGLRVSREAEMEGLDVSEHGLTAYSNI
ncbi:MAG: ammonium transporter [Planctomycetes bacterium]|nr:ammonium transporter [Planctomycetota bacterium]